MDPDLQGTQQREDTPLPRAKSYLPIHERFAIAVLVTAASLWIRVVDVLPDNRRRS